MTVAACDGNIGWAEGALLKPERDSLAIDRCARSAEFAPSDG
jgi:hypothetical protein